MFLKEIEREKESERTKHQSIEDKLITNTFCLFSTTKVSLSFSDSNLRKVNATYQPIPIFYIIRI